MAAVSTGARIAVDGKFFRLEDKKWHLKGVAYGPFAPNVAGEFFPEPEQAEADLQHIVELGANTLRVYYPPPAWLLELAEQRGLRLFVDVPWAKHLCFLDSPESRADARRGVRNAALLCAWHPAVFALSVVNEIPPDIVRWSGAAAIAGFIEQLIEDVKAVDPGLLCTFGNYPPTEFLRVPNLDFVCYNVYLHQERAFENYLARLQMIADTRPLVLGEIGIDSLREGETGQTEMLSWQIERACRNGAAGTVIFSFTDRWFKNDQWIEDWSFGLVRRDGSAKPAFFAVQQRYRAAPHFPLAAYPEVSVVVASYNGARTLRNCLESLCALNYPSYEVILIDDGSTDETPSIVADFPSVRCVHQPNLGLSVARNTGIACARGEIIAFTDSDCRADRDWLYYLVGELLRESFAGVGGHNFLPPDDSWIAAAVMASPGGPAHVMVTDRVAEHVPGCNMAFYKWALVEIGGFDPIFRRAGDDVDVCWRLQQRGYQIGFSPGGFVWHYRRSTARDYLEQQYGYGEAEALLVRKHPEYFNAIGGSLWQGRIYSHAHFGVSLRPGVIYHGPFGSGLFQSVYAAPPTAILSFFTSIEYYVVVTLPLLVLSIAFGILTPLAITSLVLSAVVCVLAGGQAEIPRAKRRFWSRPLVALLHFLQPIVRGTARYQGRLHLATEPLARPRLSPSARRREGSPPAQLYYWSDGTGNRLLFLKRIIEALDEQGWPNKTDAGWNDFDVEVFGNRWSRLQLLTATEAYDGDQQRICCRLQTRWSLSALVLFWAAVAMELLIIGVLGRLVPALWWLLFSLPLIGWLLQRQGARLQWDVTQFLDGVASHCGLSPDPARPS